MKTLLLKTLAVAALSIGAMLIPLATALFAVGKDDYWRPLVNIKQLFPQPRIKQCFELQRKWDSGKYQYAKTLKNPFTYLELAKYICLNCSEYKSNMFQQERNAQTFTMQAYETMIYDCTGEPMGVELNDVGSPEVIWLYVQDTYQLDSRIAWMVAQSSPKLPSLAIFTEEYYERYNVYSKTYVKKNSYY